MSLMKLKSKALATLVFGLMALLPGITLGQTARDWRTWPFSWDSPWNHPIGSGAVYETVTGLNSLASGFNFF